jgi:site-specific recombinase XerD
MPPKTRATDFLTQQELRDLLKAASDHPRDRALLYVAYRHGLRASEVGMLRYADWNTDEDRLTITRLKDSLDGIHDMDTTEVKLLRSYLRTRKDKIKANAPLFANRAGGTIHRRTLQDVMRKYAAKAGIPRNKAFFHNLKHSIATHLLNAGADVMTIKNWLGHQRIENTLIYAQLSDQKRDDEVRKAMTNIKVI